MLDLDNTLGNRTAAVRAWIPEFCAEWNLPTEAGEWIFEQDNDGYSTRTEVFAAIRDRYALAPPVEDLVAKYQDRIIALAAPTTGAIQALGDLRALGHTLAIVTNGSTKQQHGKIDAIGFRTLVDAVIVSGDIAIKKPDARIFRAAADATGKPLTDAWMVGDSPTHDILGATVLGVKTAWLRRGRTWPETSCQPTAILDDMTQLVDTLHRHG